jgi:hypothetical protein
MYKKVVDSYLVDGADFKIFPPFITPRVVEPLRDDYYIKTRTSFLIMCDKNRTAADILDMFIVYIEGRVGKNCKNDTFHTDAMEWITFSKRSLVSRFEGMSSEHTITAAIKLLVSKGFLIVKRGVSTGNTSYQQSNKYKVNVSVVREAHSKVMGVLKTRGYADRFGITLSEEESLQLNPFHCDITYRDSEIPPNEHPQMGWSETAPVPSNGGGAELLQGGANLLRGGAELLHDKNIYTEVLIEEDSTDSSESYVNNISSLYCSGNQSTVISERATVGVLEVENVLESASVQDLDSLNCSSLYANNLDTKTNSTELYRTDSKTEEEEKTSSRLKEAPTELFFNMDDVRTVVASYHRQIPMKGRPKGDGSVNGLLTKYGHKVESLLSDYPVEKLEEALGAFLQDEFWQKKGYPLNGFISQIDRFADNGPRSDFQRSKPVGYQKPETIEPDPVSAPISVSPEEREARRLRVRVQELRTVAMRCKMNEEDFDLSTASAVESSFGRALSIFEEMHGYQYPVTTSPCKT